MRKRPTLVDNPWPRGWQLAALLLTLLSSSCGPAEEPGPSELEQWAKVFGPAIIGAVRVDEPFPSGTGEGSPTIWAHDAYVGLETDGSPQPTWFAYTLFDDPVLAGASPDFGSAVDSLLFQFEGIDDHHYRVRFDPNFSFYGAIVMNGAPRTVGRAPRVDSLRVAYAALDGRVSDAVRIEVQLAPQAELGANDGGHYAGLPCNIAAGVYAWHHFFKFPAQPRRRFHCRTDDSGGTLFCLRSHPSEVLDEGTCDAPDVTVQCTAWEGIETHLADRTILDTPAIEIANEVRSLPTSCTEGDGNFSCCPGG